MAQTMQLVAEVRAQAAKVALSELDKQVEELKKKKIEIVTDSNNQEIKRVKQLKDELGNVYTVVEKLNQKTKEWTTTTKISEDFEKEAKAAQKAAAEAQKAGEAHEKTAKQTEELGKQTEQTTKSVDLLSTAFSRLSQIAISQATRAFRDALKEMKNVDSELVTVRKVTDASAEQLEYLRDRAYDTGKAYGVAASDYLSSVAEFSRAGYKDQAADLAELAVKLQLVGDVSQDVANQFLIATDKSFKFQGSADKLSETIDKANEIDNNYATTIEKVASGMGIIAPVAAQLNVSLDETMAAVGTITAVTQRSGTEAARALRAIMLNIVGDTKTEIEDGATWTAGEIIGLRDLLKEYAPQIVAEAEKMGTVINPMEAIGALAKAYKDGVLNAQELTERVSDIGGKLRTPQLLALIQNWDEIYLQMMGDIEDAAGSADKEVENALTGWEAKINILKTTWTDFVQETIDSDLIKGGIDALTWLIDSFGNLGNAIATAIPFIIAFKGQDIASWFRKAGETALAFTGDILGLGDSFLDAGSAAETSAARFKGAMSLIGIAIGATIMIVNNYKKSLDDAIAQGDKAASELKSIQGLYDKWDELNKTAADTKEAEDARQALIDKLDDEGVWVDTVTAKYETLEEKIKGATEAALNNRRVELADALQATRDKANFLYRFNFMGYSANDAADVLGFGRSYPNPNGMYNVFDLDIERLTEVYDKAVARRNELYNTGAKNSDEDKKLQTFIKTYKEVVENYKTTSKLLDEINEKTESQRHISSAADAEIRKQALSFVGLKGEIEAATKALENYNKALEGGEKGDTLKQYADIYKQAKELFESGYYGSTQYKAAIDLLLPDDLKQQLGYDYKALGEYVFGEFASGAYELLYGSGGEDFGAILATYLRDNADGMESIYEVINDNGNTFDLLIHDEEALAKALGMTTEQIYTWMDAMDIRSSDIMLSSNDVQDLIKKYGELSKGIITDGVGLVKGLVDNGRTEGEIRNIIDQLDRAGQIDMGSLPEDLSEAIKKFQEINEAEKDLPKEAIIEIKTDPESGYFDEVLQEIKTLDGQTITIGIRYSVDESTKPESRLSSSGVSHAGHSGTFTVGQANWQGVTSATAGTSVINEEGAELIVRGRRAFITNNGKPTLVDLKAGDRVFNAKETRDILTSKKKPERINDFGSGGAETWTKTGVTVVGSGIPETYPDKDKGDKGDSGSGGGNKSSTPDVKDSELLSMLDDYISEMLDKAKKALDAQLDTIDAQIEKLKAEHDAEEEANELEELRLKILEAEKNLVDANVERTVRYFNKATGQWEWMADQKAVAEAQKSLEDAQQNYYDKLADIEYQAKLDELQAQKDALNENYDNLSDTWSEIKDEISKALSEKDVLELAEILTRLGLTAASGSVGGVNTLISNIDSFTGSFDNGGFANGKGLLWKATSKTETVLDDAITDRILSPRSNSQFTSFTNALSKLFGMSSGDIGAKAQSLINTIDRSSSVVGDTYYINGVEIGSNMLDRPLSEVLSVLPIYAG